MILLTGSTGYLGSQIAQELVRRGIPFRVLVRDPSRLKLEIGNWKFENRNSKFETRNSKVETRNSKVETRSAAAGYEIVIGDLSDPGALARALRGVQQVIHTAALVKVWAKDRQDFWRVNVDGLKNLCRAAAKAGVERIVYTSSFIALGPSADPNAGEELRHDGKFRNEYEQTKAEALVWLRDEGYRQFPVITLLPGVIYGKGPLTEGNMVGNMIHQYLFKMMPALVGSGRQRWSFAYNRDVAAAHVAALTAGRLGQEYILGGDNRSLNDFYRALAQVSGLRHRVRHVPFGVGKILGGMDVALALVAPHQPVLTPGAIEIFKHDWVYSSGKAVRELNYHVTPLDEGLRATLANA
ncbi:MAG TPA: NAD-dependent epimerase/dehydratase family protein [Candidatus Sulfopaludibacter sp.]|nr:NAD-dependent epimerase/dehydratase family protein [Terriglobia bacterium]HEV2447232.1 NAD-dependent epimerase/dehydratase family protein [Candidatus Sulfopaludibacter sp.]